MRAPLAQTPLWISVEDADDRVVERIGRYFGLHPLTIEDCQSKGIREKLEVFPEYLFLVFHALEESAGSAGRVAASASSSSSARHSHSHSSAAGGLEAAGSEIMRTTPLKLVVFPSLVLSFHKGALPSVTLVRRQLDKLYSNRVLNTAWLIHGLLDVVSDSLMPVVDTATNEADDMEDEIYIINPGRESHKDVLRRMGAIARRLTFLRQRLWSKRDILTSLIEKDWQSFLTGVKVPYLRDIYDHLVIMLHKLDASIEVIVTLQSTYLAVVSIDVAAVSNDGNKAMKTLSAAATILLPLSLIASLMGMNVMVRTEINTDCTCMGAIGSPGCSRGSVGCVCVFVVCARSCRFRSTPAPIASPSAICCRSAPSACACCSFQRRSTRTSRNRNICKRWKRAAPQRASRGLPLSNFEIRTVSHTRRTIIASNLFRCFRIL